jgi:hypothetical protein
MNLDPSQAGNLVRNLMEKVKSVNGTFTCLWHNESLSGFRNGPDGEGIYLDGGSSVNSVNQECNHGIFVNSH